MKRNYHKFKFSIWGDYIAATCLKCKDKYTVEQNTRRLINAVSNDYAGYSIDHGYFCMVKKKVKVVSVSSTKQLTIWDIDDCTLTDKEYMIKNIIK